MGPLDQFKVLGYSDIVRRYGAAFMFDTGTSTGVIGGHSKVDKVDRLAIGTSLTYLYIFRPINSVSIRHQRPFRAITAADDTTIIFHSGMSHSLLYPVHWMGLFDIFMDSRRPFQVRAYDPEP